MQTKDLPVGAHVAYRINRSRRYPEYREAYVYAHRGKTYGTADTIGIAVVSSSGRQWYFEWVRPADIVMTWDERVAQQTRWKTEREAQAQATAAAQAKRKDQLSGIPKAVLDALGLDDYQADTMVERGSYSSYRMTLDKIEAVIRAARLTDPAGSDSIEIEDTLNRFGISL